jgi:hypothetical protein
MKGAAKRIANDLKDNPAVAFDGVIQNLMVPRQESGHGIRMFLCQFRTAFDISK